MLNLQGKTEYQVLKCGIDHIGLSWWLTVKRIHLPMKETRAQSLGGEDPLQKAMAPTPVFLPGEAHGQGPGGPQPVGLQSQTRLSH